MRERKKLVTVIWGTQGYAIWVSINFCGQQCAVRIPDTTVPKKNTLSHSTVKLLKAKNERKILKATKEKCHVPDRVTTIWLTTDIITTFQSWKKTSVNIDAIEIIYKITNVHNFNKLRKNSFSYLVCVTS